MVSKQNTANFQTSVASCKVVLGPPNDGGGIGDGLRGSTGGDKSAGFGGTNSGGKDGQLCCPKCGNPCTHVETFVSKCCN